ncbi:MAG: hypothetical protein AAF228_12730 [Pseudomonadota bacterium]
MLKFYDGQSVGLENFGGVETGIPTCSTTPSAIPIPQAFSLRASSAPSDKRLAKSSLQSDARLRNSSATPLSGRWCRLWDVL